MIKIFIPQTKGKNKTDVRGLWQSPENKLFYDYLTIAKTTKKENTNFKELCYRLNFYKKVYNQECIFFIDTIKKLGNIYYNNDKIEVLKNRNIIKVKRQGKNTKTLKIYIKSALKLYSGLTIYIKKHNYILEVYHN